MLNKYPAWKYILIAIALTFGVIYSLPNLYPDDFAVQVTSIQSSAVADEALHSKVKKSLSDAGIAVKGSELVGNNILVRFDSNEQQLAAKDALARTLGNDYIAALNMAASTPDWLRSFGAGPMKLGLDLRGGVHFLLEVDMEKALSQKLKISMSDLKTVMRNEKIRYRSVSLDGVDGLKLKFKSEKEMDEAVSLVAASYRQFTRETSEKDEFFFLSLQLSEARIKEIEDKVAIVSWLNCRVYKILQRQSVLLVRRQT